MKKIIFVLMLMFTIVSCGPTYNSALKQVELGMTKQDITTLMGEKYTTSQLENIGNQQHETIEYKDMYKFHWFFQFVDNKLVKWWKEKE